MGNKRRPDEDRFGNKIFAAERRGRNIVGKTNSPGRGLEIMPISSWNKKVFRVSGINCRFTIGIFSYLLNLLQESS